MAISSLSAAAGVSPLLLAPVKMEVPLKHHDSGVVGLGNLPSNLHHKQRLAQTVCIRSGPVVCTASGFGKPSLLHLNHKQQLNHTSGLRSAALICAAALNARCGAEGQTQTVEKPVSVISKAPIHEKSPLLDDGGSGFPPRDDDGGGGGGGGGGNWSGGFFFFGFLAFLGFLKDKEDEGPYQDSRRN